ncbi:MAG: PorV/PorQ family protein, partial [Bacteroidota bacterium]
SGASELLIPVGTRGIAMGSAVTATAEGIDALFWNPAGAAKTTADVTIYASHMLYIADIGVSGAAVSVNLESFGVLSLHLKALSIGDIPVTTVFTPDGTGQTFSPQFFDIGLTYSRRITDRVLVGATVLIVTEQMAEVSATGVAFNLGVAYDNLVNVQGLSIGAAVKNIGPQMKFDGPGLNVSATSSDQLRGEHIYKIDAVGFELPTTFELGLGYQTRVAEEHSLHFATAFQNNNFSSDQYKVGLEYGFQQLLFLRAGYDYAPTLGDDKETIFGATFGAGLNATFGGTVVQFDYAYRAVKYFSNSHIFSVVLGL